MGVRSAVNGTLDQAAFFSARCSTGLVASPRFIAVVMSATCEKACGKLPSMRASRIIVPLSYADELYALRQNIDLVRMRPSRPSA